jgi:3-phosphoinositide dependent protein kinase-1
MASLAVCSKGLLRTPTETNAPASNFFFGDVIGEGAYAKVYVTKRKKCKRLLAAKVMEILFIVKHGKQNSVLTEVRLLKRLQHPNLIKLFCSFKTKEHLFLITDYCSGGELRTQIDMHKNNSETCDTALPLPTVRFYLGEIISGIKYLHLNDIVHRDLKPENILLSNTGHVKLADLGSALDLTNCSSQSRTDFVGTAEYVSPELLRDDPVGKGSDIWSLGCIFFQMIVGRPPFRGESEYLTFQKIGEFSPASFLFPPSIDETCKSLIIAFLRKDPECRLGAGTKEMGFDFSALVAHPFFSGENSFSWLSLEKQNAPILLGVKSVPEPKKDGTIVDFSFLELDDIHSFGTEESDMASLTPMENIKIKDTLPQKPPFTLDQKWLDHIRKEEEVIYAGRLWKRRYFSCKERYFILTSSNIGPRLFYFDEDVMTLKGEIPWVGILYINLLSAKKFDIKTPNRTYHLSDESNQAHHWISAIEYVNRYFSQKAKNS